VTELEFLPDDYLKARFHRRVGFIRSWLLLALGLAMVLWSLQIGVWVRDARAELQGLRGAGFAAAADVEKVEMLRAEVLGYARRVAAIKRLQPQVTVAETVEALTSHLPDAAALDEVRLSRSAEAPEARTVLRVTGWAPCETHVNEMLGQLESSGRFGHAVLVESKPQKRQGATWRWFVIEAAVLETTGAKGG
jgi:hypothetical protein